MASKCSEGCHCAAQLPAAAEELETESEPESEGSEGAGETHVLLDVENRSVSSVQYDPCDVLQLLNPDEIVDAAVEQFHPRSQHAHPLDIEHVQAVHYCLENDAAIRDAMRDGVGDLTFPALKKQDLGWFSEWSGCCRNSGPFNLHLKL